MRVESRCVEDADDSAAESGLVGFFIAAACTVLDMFIDREGVGGTTFKIASALGLELLSPAPD
jgi:hypothetical protein